MFFNRHGAQFLPFNFLNGFPALTIHFDIKLDINILIIALKRKAFFVVSSNEKTLGELVMGSKRTPNQASLRCVNVTSNCNYSFFIGRFEPQYGQAADCFPVHFTSSERIGPPHCGQGTGNRSTRWMGSTGAGVILVGTVGTAIGTSTSASFCIPSSNPPPNILPH